MNLDIPLIKDFTVLITAITGISYFVAKYVFAQELNITADRLAEKFSKTIKELISEIKEDRESILSKIEENREKIYFDSERIGKVEESTKAAHNRIKELKDDLND